MDERNTSTSPPVEQAPRRDYEPPELTTEDIFTAVSVVCTRVSGCQPDPEGEIPFPQS